MATQDSYSVSLLIANTGKPHSIGEHLVKQLPTLWLTYCFRGQVMKLTGYLCAVTQSSSKSVAENVENQLMTRLRHSQFFSLQLDESTDIGKMSNLLCFVRYTYAGRVYDEFLFCHSLPTNTTGETIFDSLSDFIVKNNLNWTTCVGICTDGATAMTGNRRD